MGNFGRDWALYAVYIFERYAVFAVVGNVPRSQRSGRRYYFFAFFKKIAVTLHSFFSVLCKWWFILVKFTKDTWYLVWFNYFSFWLDYCRFSCIITIYYCLFWLHSSLVLSVCRSARHFFRSKLLFVSVELPLRWLYISWFGHISARRRFF